MQNIAKNVIKNGSDDDLGRLVQAIESELAELRKNEKINEFRIRQRQSELLKINSLHEAVQEFVMLKEGIATAGISNAVFDYEVRVLKEVIAVPVNISLEHLKGTEEMIR